MRRLLLFVIFLAVILGGLWLGGETLLARMIRQNAQHQPMLQLQDVTPLRDPGRFGVRGTQLTVDSDGRKITLPEVTVWAPLSRLNSLHLSLPPRIELAVLGQPQEIGLDDAGASVTVAPLNGMAIRQATAHSGPVMLGGQPLAEAADLDVTLSRLGYAVPRGAATSYDVTIDLQKADPRVLTPVEMPEGTLSITGTGRVWLDRILTPETLRSGRHPLPVGFRTDGMHISFTDLDLRLMGRVLRDASGYAEGEVMIYTADAPAILDLAVQQNLLKPGAAQMIGKALQQLSDDTPETQSESERTLADTGLNAGRVAQPDLDPMHFPTPAEGELRLPLTFKGGKMMLGPLPLGPAPLFAQAEGA